MIFCFIKVFPKAGASAALLRQTAKQNKSIREKVGEILQRIADKVMAYFKGDKANGLLAHNAQAQAFLDDHQALERMAVLCSTMFDEARENERKFGGRESEERLSKIYGIPKNNQFPPYRVSKSDAHKLAIEWANNDNVKSGDWKLAIYHQRWYIIEKYDDTTLKYQVVECVHQKDFSRIVKMWEKQYGRKFEEEMGELYYSRNNLNRETTQHGQRGSVVDDDVFEQSPKNQQVYGLGKDEDSGQQTRIDTRRSNAHSDNDSKGVRTFELTSNPNARKSKDDTIYDGMYEDGDLYFGGLRTRWNSRHFYQVNDNISRHLGAYTALR